MIIVFFLILLLVILFILIKKRKIERFIDKKISVDIFIPIYFEGSVERYKLTEKMFKYLNRIRKNLKNDISLSFTIVGCNNNQSKNLYNKYFSGKDDIYIPFNQEKLTNYYFNKKFKDVLRKKINLGLLKSIKKNKNINLMQGSNDFISENFFKQLKKKYISKKKQMFGINRPINNQKNVTVMKNIDNSLKFISEDPYYNNNKFNDIVYMGGIIGFSNINTGEFKTLNFLDEVELEKKLTKKFNLQKVLFDDIIILNIKTDNDISKLKETDIEKNKHNKKNTNDKINNFEKFIENI